MRMTLAEADLFFGVTVHRLIPEVIAVSKGRNNRISLTRSSGN
jgi:hypothetical protein